MINLPFRCISKMKNINEYSILCKIGDTNKDLEVTRRIQYNFRVKGSGIADCRDRVDEIKER